MDNILEIISYISSYTLVARILIVACSVIFIATLVFGRKDEPVSNTASNNSSQQSFAIGVQNAQSITNNNFQFSEKSADVSLDNTIQFKCNWSAPPSIYRDDKTLYMVDFQRVPITGINPDQQIAGPMSFRRGSEPFKASNQYSNIWYICTVTNYSTTPIKNLRAKFPVFYAKSEKTKNGSQSGKILANGYALSPAIDLAPNESDYFYFANGSSAYIVVKIPNIGELQLLSGKNLSVQFAAPSESSENPFILPPSENPFK